MTPHHDLCHWRGVAAEWRAYVDTIEDPWCREVAQIVTNRGVSCSDSGVKDYLQPLVKVFMIEF